MQSMINLSEFFSNGGIGCCLGGLAILVILFLIIRFNQWRAGYSRGEMTATDSNHPYNGTW